MAEKDMTEKALEAFNDVFADIINSLVFHGRKQILEDELEQGRERSVYQGENLCGSRKGTHQSSGRNIISVSLISALKMKQKQRMICRCG